MSLYTHDFDLNITPGAIPPRIKLSQYDDSRTYTAHLKADDGSAFTLASGATATLHGKNCKGVTFDIEATVSGADVTFTPKEAATDQPGEIHATLCITSGDEQISPLAITLDIQKDGATKEEIARSPGFTNVIDESTRKWLNEKGLLAGHVATPYAAYQPAGMIDGVEVSTNYIGTKIGDGIWRLQTDDTSLPTRVGYNIPIAMRGEKWRVAIQNNAAGTLCMDENIFALKAGNVNADDYTSYRHILSGSIGSGETCFWDFTPNDYGSDTSALWLYFYAETPIDITVSVGTLGAVSTVATADEKVTAVAASSATDLKDLGFTKTGVVDGVRRGRPQLASTKLLDLFDYMGMNMPVKLEDGWCYRLDYYRTEDETASGGLWFSDADYSTAATFPVRARYAIIYIKKTDGLLILPEELASAFALDPPALLGEDMRVRGNLCDPAHVAYGMSLNTSDDGRMVSADDRAVTGFIEIPKTKQDVRLYAPYKYVKACALDKHMLYATVDGEQQPLDMKNDYYWGFTAHMIVFYDEDKHYLGKIDNNVTLWTRTLTEEENGYPAGTPIRQRAYPSEAINVESYYSAAYVRVVFYGTASRFYVGFGSNDDLADYEEYLSVPKNIFSIAGTVRNTNGAVTDLIRSALRYAYNETFGYGNHYTAYHPDPTPHEWDGVQTGDYDRVDWLQNPFYFGEKYQIDCSAFSRLAIQCIPPENSRYYGGDNVPGPCGHVFNSRVSYVNEQGRLTANAIAQYAHENGWLYTVASDMSNVEVGDVLFLSDADPVWEMFRDIGHAMFVVDKWRVNEGYYHVYTLESVNTFPTVKRVLRLKDPGYAMGSRIVYGARLPFPAGELDTADLVANFDSAEKAVTMAKDDVLTLSSLTLSAPLKERDIYTVCLKANVPEGTHLEMRITGKLTTWSYTMNGTTRTGVEKETTEPGDQVLGLRGGNVWHGNTGEYTLRGITYGDIEITEPYSIKIVLVADEDITGQTASVTCAKVICGYYTQKVVEFS